MCIDAFHLSGRVFYRASTLRCDLFSLLLNFNPLPTLSLTLPLLLPLLSSSDPLLHLPPISYPISLSSPSFSYPSPLRHPPLSDPLVPSPFPSPLPSSSPLFPLPPSPTPLPLSLSLSPLILPLHTHHDTIALINFDPVKYEVEEGQTTNLELVLSRLLEREVIVQLNIQDVSTSGKLKKTFPPKKTLAAKS